MAETNGLIFPVATKLLHIKFIFITDSTAAGAKPAYRRKLRRSGEEFDVYDSSIFYQYTQFSADHRPRDYQWEFTSSHGEVDALQLQPFMPSTFDPDPARRSMHASVEGYLRPTPDSLLVVCHNYNGFQKPDGEWAGIRASDDTELLRLIVDFSSIMVEENARLFVEEPAAYWVHLAVNAKGHTVEQNEKLDFEFAENSVYSVARRQVEKKDVLKIIYKLNWDALINWQGYTRGNKPVTPFVYQEPF